MYPLFNPIEWESIGDPEKRFKKWWVGDLRQRALEYYDAGASGLAFWDVSAAFPDGALAPIVRRMGHVDDVRAHLADGPPVPVTCPIKKWAGIAYGGRYSPWVGG